MCLHTSFSCLCFYLSLLDINKPLCLSAVITCLLRSNSQIVQAATTVKSLQLCKHRLQKWNTMLSLNKLKVARTVYTVKWDTSLNQAKSAWIKTLTSTDLAEEGRREVASLDSDAAEQTFLVRLLQNIFFNCLLAYKTSHISNIQVTTAVLKPKQTAGKPRSCPTNSNWNKCYFREFIALQQYLFWSRSTYTMQMRDLWWLTHIQQRQNGDGLDT